MNLAERTYTLVRDWFAEREREALRRDVIEGCRETGSLQSEIDREWNDASDEAWRGLD